MDYIFHICLLIVASFSRLSYGQEEPLVISFEDGTDVKASMHSSVDLRCHINRDAFFALNNVIQMVHIHPVTKKETVMSTSGSLGEAAPPSFYSIVMKPNPNGGKDSVVDFKILDVTERDDGIYRCKVTPKDSTVEVGHADRHVLVNRPMDSLKLMLSDFEPIEQSPSEPIKLDAGQYKVGCIAEGSNPEAKVNMFFHGMDIEGSTSESTLMEHEFRRYRTKASADLNLMVSNSGQELTCEATDSTGKHMSVKLAIQVNIYDASITCNDTDAFVGKANPVLTCIVNHTNLQVDGFSFQIGDTGEIIREGEKNAEHMFVNVTKVKEGISLVSLDLHLAKHELLDKNYYVLIDIKGGHTSKESVRLNKVEANTGPRNSGRLIYPTVALYLLMLFACAWTH